MSADTPIPPVLITGLPGTGKTTQPKVDHLPHQPALVSNIVGKDLARHCALEAMEAWW